MARPGTHTVLTNGGCGPQVHLMVMQSHKGASEKTHASLNASSRHESGLPVL